MDILQWSVLFVIALAVVIKSADYFTTTAEKIGLHFRIPPFIIGVTIIAFGTSLPEVVTSISGVINGESSLVINNVVGSNLANILLVLGISAVVGGNLKVSKDIINIDLPISLSSIILLFITAYDGKITLIDGAILFLALITYVLYNVQSHRKVEGKEARELSQLKKEEKLQNHKKQKLHFKYPLILLGSGIFLWFSADLTIKAVINLATILNIAPDLIAITAVALGTSLPELVVSATAAYKGKADIAIGNVMGSNIFNALGVMSIPAIFGNLEIPSEMLLFGIPTLLLVTILYIFTTMDKQVSRWEGIIMVLVYLAIIGKVLGIM